MCLLKKSGLVAFLLIQFLPGTFSQTGSWNILNVKLDLHQKWTLFAETQLRSLQFYKDFHYYELKGGFTYSFSKTFSISAGAGIFDTYSPGGNFKRPMANDEWRSWVQLNMSQYEKKLKFEHRYRAEQRFTANGYRNRFRYRLSTVLPLGAAKITPGTFYLNASDELFFTDKAPYFERNRLFLGGGHQFSEKLTLQAGFINQFDYRINDETGRNFLQLSLLFELEAKRKTGEKVPGGME